MCNSQNTPERQELTGQSNTIQNGAIDLSLPINISGSAMFGIAFILIIIGVFLYFWRYNRCGENANASYMRQIRRHQRQQMENRLYEYQLSMIALNNSSVIPSIQNVPSINSQTENDDDNLTSFAWDRRNRRTNNN